MRFTCTLPLFALITGCISDSELIRSDNTAKVMEMTRQRATIDLKCTLAVADRPIRRDSMSGWTQALHSEYTAWAEGCNKQVRYLVVCKDGDVCFFADQRPPED